ncbi:MAG TPA: hypothetical protein VFL61_06820 [Gaiellaceae bacterium]|nr:hypothetical protein [Gaiellaceae bacterium]
MERGTTTRYDSVLRVYLLPEFGNAPVGRITHEIVQRYVNRLAADPEISAAQVRGVYATLRPRHLDALHSIVASVRVRFAHERQKEFLGERLAFGVLIEVRLDH